VVARLDRHGELALLPMRDPQASPYLDRPPEEERYATWHLVLLDGSLVGRGVGGVDLLDTMHLTRGLGRLVGHVPDAVLDRAYEVVASRRGRLGRLVPNRPGPRRFP
jgi:hypothetical protein